jgi:AbiV family abortive infection protein
MKERLVSDENLQIGISLCNKKKNELLEGAKLLLGKKPTLALGLYCYALEEFGKGLCLQELIGVDNNEQFIKKLEETFTQHKYKIDRATKELPEFCTKVSYGVHLEYNIHKKTRTIGYRPITNKNQKEPSLK